MKILVLMPCDEKWAYMATEIYKDLPDEVKDITWAVPMMMEYLIATKISPNYADAMTMGIFCANRQYDAAEQGDLIIIGNCAADKKFDLVLNFQDSQEALPYEDKFLEKMRELGKDKPLLVKTYDTHKGEESSLSLKNCQATADLLADLIAAGDVSSDLAALQKAYINKWGGEPHGWLPQTK